VTTTPLVIICCLRQVKLAFLRLTLGLLLKKIESIKTVNTLQHNPLHLQTAQTLPTNFRLNKFFMKRMTPAVSEF
jgi:hypothetical protein